MKVAFFAIGIIIELIGAMLILGSFGGLESELMGLLEFLGLVACGVALCIVGHFFVKSAVDNEGEEGNE